MGLFSSKSKSSTTSRNTAYAPYKGAIDRGGSIIDSYLNNPNSNAVYSGPRVADMSADTQSGINLMRQSSGANDSMGYLKNLLNTPAGEGNPQVAQMQDAIRRQVAAQTAAQFSNAGMTGGTQHQGVLARGLADGMAQPLFAAYESDRNRQMQAAGLLPQVDQQRIANMAGAGQIQDSYAQNKINADRQLFEENRTAPLKAWSEVAPVATQIGAQFGTQSSNSTQKNSPGIGNMIAGGLMAGAGLMTGNPMMAKSALGGMGGGGSAPYAQSAEVLPWLNGGRGGYAQSSEVLPWLRG